MSSSGSPSLSSSASLSSVFSSGTEIFSRHDGQPRERPQYLRDTLTLCRQSGHMKVIGIRPLSPDETAPPEHVGRQPEAVPGPFPYSSYRVALREAIRSYNESRANVVERDHRHFRRAR